MGTLVRDFFAYNRLLEYQISGLISIPVGKIRKKMPVSPQIPPTVGVSRQETLAQT